MLSRRLGPGLKRRLHFTVFRVRKLLYNRLGKMHGVIYHSLRYKNGLKESSVISRRSFDSKEATNIKKEGHQSAVTADAGRLASYSHNSFISDNAGDEDFEDIDEE